MRTPGAASASIIVVVALAAFYAWTLRGSQPAKPVRIGVVQLTAVDAETFEGFRAGMAERGYREESELRYLHPGPAVDADRLEAIIAGHLAAGVDLFFVSSTPATQAVKRATAASGIPVVFAPVNDPVEAQVVATLQAPGGNITGIRLPQGDGLRLHWLLTVAPDVRRVLVPFSTEDASARESLRQVKAESDAFGIELLPQPLTGPQAFRNGLPALPDGIDAILLPRDSSITAHIVDYAALAIERRLPLCAPGLAQVHAGALLSYGFSHREIGHQAARLADSILRGTAPADLPVETARSYLALNLKTADAIGIRLSDQVLRQARVLVR